MFWLIPLLYSSFILQRVISEKDNKLLLVQTLFRHGDRAPRHLYPTDPNSKDSWPEGLGKLTLIGKKQQYALGKFLRSRYQDFITTNPNEVLVNSSAADRCLTSAAANLAAFYAPEERWKIEDGLNWQPIPIHFLPPYQDKVDEIL
ncbi:Testicular acid phosphatase [Araneus ventricosus]|uniref:Testicular acid phosphatase n=1 Tax=Araneus ventricosus TaxID=182803 RepID=A0A4Y2T779_ARAVE|nr:Testicular acid phosphatase [Araneus ventricosus]